MTAVLGESQPSGSSRHRAPDDAPTGSMGVIPTDRRARDAHASDGRPRPGAGASMAAPVSRAARTAGLSLAALGALAGAGGVAAGDLVSAPEEPATGEFALPTNLAAADVNLASSGATLASPAVADVATSAVMPATASAPKAGAQQIKTTSPASRAADAAKAVAAKAAQDKAEKDKAEKAEKAAAAAPGAKAVSLAKSQIGVPYEWGGTTPGGFDCSGLMQWAFEKVGKELPRTSAAQAQEGTEVSMDELQPGDLVYMYSPVTHIGMYAGNGQIIEAPTEGEDVKMTPISDYEDEITGARRL